MAGESRRFLAAMQARALDGKARRPASPAEHYEMIAAQFTVPLVILENARWPNPKAQETIEPSPPPTPPADDGEHRGERPGDPREGQGQIFGNRCTTVWWPNCG